MRALVLAFVMASSAVSPVFAAPPDAQARRLIVGDWIASPTQADTRGGAAQETLRRALARYNPDGTGHVQVFSDAACSRLAFTRTFRWRIESGAVVTVAAQGDASRDEIVSLDDQSMTLRLSGRLEHRIRAATCSRQMGV